MKFDMQLIRPRRRQRESSHQSVGRGVALVTGDSTAYCNSCPRKKPQVGRGSLTRTTPGGAERLEQEVTSGHEFRIGWF